MRGVNDLYHVGDVVQVKSPLLKCSHGLNEAMKMMAGQIVTIERVLSDGYWLKEDPEKWNWCDLCFDPVYQEPEQEVSLEGLL